MEQQELRLQPRKQPGNFFLLSRHGTLTSVGALMFEVGVNGGKQRDFLAKHGVTTFMPMKYGRGEALFITNDQANWIRKRYREEPVAKRRINKPASEPLNVQMFEPLRVSAWAQFKQWINSVFISKEGNHELSQ